jgi:hypothetical protein
MSVDGPSWPPFSEFAAQSPYSQPTAAQMGALPLPNAGCRQLLLVFSIFSINSKL